jgi:hypothetical protein
MSKYHMFVQEGKKGHLQADLHGPLKINYDILHKGNQSRILTNTNIPFRQVNKYAVFHFTNSIFPFSCLVEDLMALTVSPKRKCGSSIITSSGSLLWWDRHLLVG